MKNLVLPAEWHPQYAIQLTWPHAGTDWADSLEEVERCYTDLAIAIACREKLIVVCNDPRRVRNLFWEGVRVSGIAVGIHEPSFYALPSNDTWARDHGALTVFEKGKPLLYDFCFNGWGMKFAANHDNLITRNLYKAGAFPGYGYSNMNFFVFEGGSIESDGLGTLLTTETCLLSPNRNDSLSRSELEGCLKQFFGAERILWLKNGYLAGDDTDSHIDTLARFCSPDTIAYVKCTDPTDEHYEALRNMETELREFTQVSGEPYRLVPLPMPPALFDPGDGHRLPATYANFLIMNDAVLIPVYNCPTDDLAIEVLRPVFPDRELFPVDCSVLIRQHGSLHCVTMQYPAPVT
ncbi:MAG TPA: agmatine deiminase family protein [Prolixibacteraceae bacterium]|nr:agmatine deiminase family protein [Prolixibacteraceae bacterium]